MVAVPAEDREVLCCAIARVLVQVVQMNVPIRTDLASAIRGIPDIKGDLSMLAGSLNADSTCTVFLTMQS
jgi:hypothetical protein